MTEDRYDGEGPDTSAVAEEVIEAEDGPMKAEVLVRTEGPEIGAASDLAEALAAANRSIVHTVFSGGGDDIEQTDDGESAELVDDEEAEDETRLMDYDA